MKNLLQILFFFFLAEFSLAQTVTVHGGTLIVNSGTSLIITSGPAKLINNAGGSIINNGTITVGGEFKNNGTSTVDNSYIMNVGGDFSNNGSNNVFVNRDKIGVVVLNGTSTQTLSGDTYFENLTINNTAAGTAVSFSDNQTVENVTTFTDGVITTGVNTLISTCASGSVIRDYSNASFINGNIRKYVSFSNCLDFDGTNDYVDLGDNIEGLTTCTFEAWIYYASGGSATYDEIFSKEYVNSLSVWRGGSDKLRFTLGTGTAWFDGGAVVSNASIPTDTWTHVAVTWNEATTEVNMYINGALDKSTTHTHSGGSVMGNNANSRGIGSYSPATADVFYGKIDELRVWDAVRTDIEIEHLMYGMAYGTEADLLAYYQFEDGAAAPSGTLTDVTANTYDGALTNMDNTDDWVSNTLHNTYPFPVGNGTATTNYYLAEMELTALTAGTFTYLDGQFASLVTGGTLSITEETTDYTGIASEGEWHIVADNAPTSVVYNMTAYTSNFSGLSDNQFTVVKRPDGSADAADWSCSPCGFSVAPAAGISANDEAGRLVADGFTIRRGFSSYSKFGIALTGTPIGPLPIELLSFYATPLDDKVKLDWSTASEINNDFFTIERSTDGLNWEEIAFIEGAGNSVSTLHYTSFDNEPTGNVLYYRLKQTDYDGQFEYSEIISIRKNSAYDYQPSIYPNPFNENTSLILSKNLINGSITISTTNGVVVYQKNNISGNTISITKDNLANGLYFVSLKENEELIYQSKLVASD